MRPQTLRQLGIAQLPVAVFILTFSVMLVTGKLLPEIADRWGFPDVPDGVVEAVDCTRWAAETLDNESMRTTKTALRDRLLAIVRNNPVPWTLFLVTTLAAIGIAVWG